MRLYICIGVIGLTLLGMMASNLYWGASAQMNVEEFVRVRYKHGLPFQEATKFGRSSVPVLLRMLADDKERPYWANIVLTLGIIGDDSAIDPLINFLEKRFEGEVDLDTLNALLTVMPALGHAAYKGNVRALNYLLTNHTIEKLAAKRINWRFQKYSGDTLDILLSKMLIRGLAVSAKQSAKDLLVKMQTDPAPEYVRLRQQCNSNISEGIDLHQRLLRDGPVATFSN